MTTWPVQEQPLNFPVPGINSVLKPFQAKAWLRELPDRLADISRWKGHAKTDEREALADLAFALGAAVPALDYGVSEDECVRLDLEGDVRTAAKRVALVLHAAKRCGECTNEGDWMQEALQSLLLELPPIEAGRGSHEVSE